jgi:uncharacterized protein (TIGR03083 family)
MAGDHEHGGDPDRDGFLAGFDPYDVFDHEADRLYRFFTSIDDATWSLPTRCDGWDVRDVLGHLRSGEDYHQACLDFRVQEFFGMLGERGATDMDSANALGIADYAGTPTDAVIESWRTIDADTRKRFRDRDGDNVDSSVGPYPARLQAFHLASELATHADDIDVPVTPDEEPARTAWRAAVCRFALKEVKPDVELEALDGATRYRSGDLEGTLVDRDFVEVANAREPRGTSVAPEVRAALSAMP